MSRPKEQLGELLRKAGEIFTVAKAADIFDTSNSETSKILSRWAKQGWVSRIKRGLYTVVPIDAKTTEQALEDSLAIVPELFAPCYIGGWSAAEHWDLTEQIFRTICVVTENINPKKVVEIRNISFALTKISPELMFGTKTIWRKERKVLISDPHKTIIDMLYNPQLGGGIQHVIGCIKEYIKSEHCDFDKIEQYALLMNNGAIFKRLGFIAESLLEDDHKITVLCTEKLTKGNAYLDSSLKDGSLITRWHLFVPESFKELM